MEFGSEKHIHPSSDVLDEKVHGLKRDVDRVPILDLQAILNVPFLSGKIAIGRCWVMCLPPRQCDAAKMIGIDILQYLRL